MSNSQNFSDNSKRVNKAPERSNFVNTCNLLSQFLKEKGGLKDLNREISGKLEAIAKSETNHVKTSATKNLLSNIEDLNQPPTQELKSQLENSSDSTFLAAAASNKLEQLTNNATSSREATMDPKSSQMTIFYDGKIWVFDGLSSDKAGEVVLLASKGSSHWSGGNLFMSSAEDLNSPPAGTVAYRSSPPVNSVSISGKQLMIEARASSGKQQVQLITDASCSRKQHVQPQIDAGSSGKQPVQPQIDASSSGKQVVQPRIDANSSDLPIARRSSLHRFLEKRKDRAVARAPYQVQNAPASSSSKSDDQQLDLKL